MKINPILLASISILVSTVSHSASFNCDKASTKVEHLICSDEQLGLLDEGLARNYKSLRTSFSPQKANTLRKEQRLWLKERNSKCSNVSECKNTYSVRIAKLGSMLTKSKKLTTHDIYEKFNMRSIFSSYGQRLKYYCESYPKNFFSKAKHVSENRLELESGDDFWVFTIKERNIIHITNQITSGTYNSETRYEIYFDNENNDWRARQTFIEIPKDCKKYAQ